MVNEDLVKQELSFKAVKSSGAGGQHVNKTASKVELYFDVESSAALEEEEKARLKRKLSSRLTKQGILVLHDSSSRSQHKNKEAVVARFLELIKSALRKPKKRKSTRPTKASKLKRLKLKKAQSEKKASRRNPLK